MEILKNRFVPTLVIIHLVFFVAKLIIGGFYLVDSFEYQYLAENILEHWVFYSGDLQSTIEPNLYTKRPPLYSVFLLLTSFGLTTIIPTLIVQNILSIISISLLKKIFEYYFEKINTKVFLIFLVTSISQFIYTNFVLSEIFLQFLIVLLVFQLFNFIRTKQFKYIIFYELVIVILFLTKPVFYLFIIPNFFILFFISKNNRVLHMLTGFIPIAILVIYCSWNYQRTGSYDFSSIQNINLKNYNLKYFLTNKYGQDYANEVNKNITLVAFEEPTYKDREQVIRKQSLDYLKKDWFDYGVFHTKGIFRFFIDPGRFDIYNFFGYPKEDSGILKELNTNGFRGVVNYLKTQPFIVLFFLVIVLLFNIVKLIGFGWFLIRGYRKIQFIFWVLLFLIGYIAFLTGPLGSSRFLIPVLLPYLYFSVCGIQDLRKVIKGYWTKTSLTSPSS